MGRPKKKPGYDSEKIMEQFTNCIVEAYMSGAGGGSVNSLRQISEQFGITLMKTRKILITVGVYHTEMSRLFRYGKMEKIFQRLCRRLA